ncbi:hypothetical protein J6524_19905 [Bradyrhizobium sp. WSM 1738]|nr:hypothetical protein [Bradyrhizobium hereditatis]MCA6117120.1 hypothetical protein [Bradyrhizobium hereditatis]
MRVDQMVGIPARPSMAAGRAGEAAPDDRNVVYFIWNLSRRATFLHPERQTNA